MRPAKKPAAFEGLIISNDILFQKCDQLMPVGSFF
jgi:hypothetical protein